MAKRIFNVLIFFAATMFFSCSGLDETSNLGKKIIENKSQDGMKPGVYKTILLEQSPQTYASVADTLSGKHIYFDTSRIYLDTLRSGEKKIVSQWTIGNWENKNEEVILKLCHCPHFEKNERRVADFLDSLITKHKIADPASVKAELLWTNTTRNNSFESANVEIGAIFSYPNDTTVFPLNFALVNPKNSGGSVPFTIGTYLLENRDEKKDTAYIERYEARYTNFVDTVKTVTFFRKFSDADPDPKENDIDTTIKPERDKITGTIDVAAYKKIYFATDKLVTWKDYVPLSLYDTNKTVFNEPSEGFNVLEIFSSKGEKIGTIKHRRDSTKYNKEFPPEDGIFDPSQPPPLLYMGYSDTLIITYEDTAIYRESKNSVKGNWENDSIVTHIKYTSAIDPVTLKPRPDTLIQTGYKYITALTEPQKHNAVRSNVYVVGGELVDIGKLTDEKKLRDSLVMYLRVNKESRENIMHISMPFIQLSYIKNGEDVTKSTPIKINIPFTEISVIAKSSDEDELTDDVPVISSTFQRFAKIDLNLKNFFEDIYKEKFFNIGLAELTLNISPQTDFPGQYGDSIRLNAIILSDTLTPQTLFTMPANRSVSSAYVKRNSGTVKLNLVETLTDFLYDEYRHIYENLPEDEENESDETGEVQTVNPFPKLEEAKAYLYLWLDDLKMGRIYFEPTNLNFTYILQTRKDGNSDKKDDTEEGGEQ
ncbi:MAG: hypothetical protein FWF51_07200 [Chitinivibrionia bacterium]|nr:hypothetical protein [Chitinivibrionia bacterium]